MTRRGSELTKKCVSCPFANRAHSLFVRISEKMNGANVHRLRQKLLTLQLAEGECPACRKYVEEYENDPID